MIPRNIYRNWFGDFKWRNLGFLLISSTVTLFMLTHCVNTQAQKPNILMIVVDDMNFVFDNPALQIPNLRKLQARGTLFSSAYCSAPRCGPSRASFLLGLRPSSTGLYYHTIPTTIDSLEYLNSLITLPQLFKDQGYTTGIYGKVFHGRKIPKSNYSEGYYSPHLGFWDEFDKKEIENFTDYRYAGGSNFAWGEIPADNEAAKTIDDITVERAISALEEHNLDPFMISVGLVRPHLPWIVPKRFYNLYPLEQIDIPPGFVENDLNDVPAPAVWFSRKVPGAMNGQNSIHKEIVNHDEWEKAIQAYYASVSYADYQIGRILKTLEDGVYSKNTIVVLFSDHGYHLGEKEHWTKFTLWEKTTQVPLIISMPGQQEPLECTSPVSLLDIYPTLIGLAGLNPPETHQLDGINISALIQDTASKRGRPVISTYGFRNHSIRDEEYRYIQYRDGSEELYDMRNDPFEFQNLASDSTIQDIKAELRKQLPKVNVNHELDGKTLGWEQYFNEERRDQIEKGDLK